MNEPLQKRAENIGPIAFDGNTIHTLIGFLEIHVLARKFGASIGTQCSTEALKINSSPLGEPVRLLPVKKESFAATLWVETSEGHRSSDV